MATRERWGCDRIVASLAQEFIMRFLTTFQITDFLDTLVSLSAGLGRR